jgi:hypothetical protein
MYDTLAQLGLIILIFVRLERTLMLREHIVFLDDNRMRYTIL